MGQSGNGALLGVAGSTMIRRAQNDVGICAAVLTGALMASLWHLAARTKC